MSSWAVYVAGPWSGVAIPPSGIDPSEARRAAERVLADRAYRDPTDSLLARVQEWVLDRIADFFDTLGRLDGGSATGLLTIALLTVVAGVGVARLARGVRREVGLAVVEFEASDRSADEWETEAAEHREAGRSRRAVACRHRATVVRLVDIGIVDRDGESRTGREVGLAAARARPDLGDGLRPLTAGFESACYGRREPTASDVADFWRRADELDRRASAGASEKSPSRVGSDR